MTLCIVIRKMNVKLVKVQFLSKFGKRIFIVLKKTTQLCYATECSVFNLCQYVVSQIINTYKARSDNMSSIITCSSSICTETESTTSPVESKEPPKKKSKLLGSVDLNSPEVQQLLKKKSKHSGALAEVEKACFKGWVINQLVQNNMTYAKTMSKTHNMTSDTNIDKT